MKSGLKYVAWSDEPLFHNGIQMVVSEFGMNSMKAWFQSDLYHQFRLVLVVSQCGGYFLGILWAP